jgi:hypothetical protein
MPLSQLYFDAFTGGVHLGAIIVVIVSACRKNWFYAFVFTLAAWVTTLPADSPEVLRAWSYYMPNLRPTLGAKVGLLLAFLSTFAITLCLGLLQGRPRQSSTR